MAFLAACVILVLSCQLLAGEVVETQVTVLQAERDTALLTGQLAWANTNQTASGISKGQKEVSLQGVHTFPFYPCNRSKCGFLCMCSVNILPPVLLEEDTELLAKGGHNNH